MAATCHMVPLGEGKGGGGGALQSCANHQCLKKQMLASVLSVIALQQDAATNYGQELITREKDTVTIFCKALLALPTHKLPIRSLLCMPYCVGRQACITAGSRQKRSSEK